MTMLRAVVIGSAIVVIAAVAGVALVSQPSPSAGRASAPTAAPRVTADPSSFTAVDPDADRGRLPADERVDRRVIVVRGLRLPIDGVALPTDPLLLPNSPRDYRAGYHEGIDFPASAGTPVHAVAAGVVIRVDRDFTDWDPNSERAALAEANELGYTPAATLDRIRGRQVWIAHGHGIVSRYAHLSAVADLVVGQAVAAGDVIGAVGSSGYPEGGPHLHLEVRVGTSYLGDALSGDALSTAIAAAFD